MFFVFKQKTAYEMRISDWSSDVCSSDLERSTQECRDLGPRPARRAGAQPAGKCAAPDDTLCHRAAALSAESFSAPRDRKSGVWGKSVSVRVDFGVGRIIKTKTKSRSQEG